MVVVVVLASQAVWGWRRVELMCVLGSVRVLLMPLQPLETWRALFELRRGVEMRVGHSVRRGIFSPFTIQHALHKSTCVNKTSKMMNTKKGMKQSEEETLSVCVLRDCPACYIPQIKRARGRCTYTRLSRCIWRRCHSSEVLV